MTDAKWEEDKGASVIRRFVVITFDGKVKAGRNGQAVLYKFVKHASRMATDDGDSVVEVEIALNKPPVFINRKVL